ncbi:hypothetical protein GWI33_016076 [Rhynchophorus ferrugineus]|uniref:Uncharacterized protein n=1 Tax=Rhynchophorus ferrugineus TaxID=354439 RepID=A0A834I2E8_RHYFE|nr:hypothetical protein GWI33_016076 [Rhynchophorus ferrugineus]
MKEVVARPSRETGVPVAVIGKRVPKPRGKGDGQAFKLTLNRAKEEQTTGNSTMKERNWILKLVRMKMWNRKNH